MTSDIPDNGQGGGGNQLPDELLLRAPEIDVERGVELLQADDGGHGGGGNQRLEVSSELLDAERLARVADEGHGGGGNQLQH